MAKYKRKPIDRLHELEHAIQPKAREVKQTLCSFPFLVNAVKTFCLVIFYYTFSIGLTFYNQRFIRHFEVPLSLTMAHLVVKFTISAFLRTLLSIYLKEARVLLPWGENLRRVAPTGIASIMDISLSNWSFEFITVSLYTMTKSTAVIFILGFSLLFRLEKPRLVLVFVVLFIAGGLFLFTFHSTQFNMKGFIMVLSASLLSGLRWTLAQIVTQKNKLGLHNPLDMMYHIQPWMILALLPLSVYFEGIKLSTKEDFFAYTDTPLIIRNVGLVFLGAFIAFFLEFSEFLLLANTSSLTLSIAGIFKEVCTLYLAASVNGDRMNFINGVGLIVCLLGISIHIIMKAVSVREENKKEGRLSREETMEMLRADDSDSEESAIFNAKTDR
ncbi:solute carrier family 35 member C2-like [Ostrea edulis]|uniref:solute carrier family 35 member C2-like n=1 Tax=Ostrea edulis TaxID=37623 RepID=UPI0020964CFA|nr:solute carrier family 35 member C2-like [Ostrea edulis]XP_048764681.1 solute carrier family 35 member C2-like [Ostrea edulis]XP_048764682.1 solute carrier family 35 member C2-like [Ostrea edulis]XP_048764688.1 solute carrier family 35 member C2-like [Ostrea edulis]XP_055995225.1 solute carrier family 35 member C2-like [Ostrea edulis]